MRIPRVAHGPAGGTWRLTLRRAARAPLDEHEVALVAVAGGARRKEVGYRVVTSARERYHVVGIEAPGLGSAVGTRVTEAASNAHEVRPAPSVQGVVLERAAAASSDASPALLRAADHVRGGRSERGEPAGTSWALTRVVPRVWTGEVSSSLGRLLRGASLPRQHDDGVVGGKLAPRQSLCAVRLSLADVRTEPAILARCEVGSAASLAHPLDLSVADSGLLLVVVRDAEATGTVCLATSSDRAGTLSHVVPLPGNGHGPGRSQRRGADLVGQEASAGSGGTVAGAVLRRSRSGALTVWVAEVPRLVGRDERRVRSTACAVADSPALHSTSCDDRCPPGSLGLVVGVVAALSRRSPSVVALAFVFRAPCLDLQSWAAGLGAHALAAHGFSRWPTSQR